MRKIVLFILLLIAPVLGEEMNELVELQTTALRENPRLKSMEKEAEMMKHRVFQSTALEDPKLKLGINNLPANSLSFTMEDMTSKEIGISQMIPVGKLGSKKIIASKEYDKARENLRLERVEILHMLRMSVYELIYIRSAIKILDDIKSQIKLVIDSEVAANKSGMGSLGNVIKANIEYGMADEELITLKQKEKEIIQKINYLAGTKVNIAMDKLPEPDFKEMPLDDIKKEIVSSNPALKMYILDREKSREEVSLKKQEYIPDVDLGLSYMQRQSGPNGKRDDMVSGMVSFNIPFWFWNKNIPMVNEMKKKAEVAENMYSDKLNDMNARAETLVSRLIKWRDLYKLYRNRLIPQTELALETTLARYKTSTIEFMPVVDSVRLLLKYKKDLSMALQEYYSAYSELTSLMGVEVLK
jgi:outer membrane protein TolC